MLLKGRTVSEQRLPMSHEHGVAETIKLEAAVEVARKVAVIADLLQVLVTTKD